MAGRDIRQGWLASGLFTSWAEEWSALVAGTPPKVQKKVSKRAKRHMDEVSEIVSAFCEEFPPARVEPTTDEMAAFWEKCYSFKSAHLAAAIVEQLSLQSGAEWQPRLRALCLLEQCFDENGRDTVASALGKAPRLVAMKVYDESEEVLQYLANQVPQCADKANEVLRLCASLPLPAIHKPPACEVTTPEATEQKLKPPPAHELTVRRASGLVNVRGPRRVKHPERQALLSDVGEQEPPLKDLETETTASSGDDDSKKLLVPEEMPFDPNVPLQEQDSTSTANSQSASQAAKPRTIF